MSKDYRMHPVFGILTDPEEIAIFDRQQAEEDGRLSNKQNMKQKCEPKKKHITKQNMNITGCFLCKKTK